MKIKINHQKNGLDDPFIFEIEPNATDQLYKGLNFANISPGQILFLVLPGEGIQNVFLTHNPMDVLLFVHHLTGKDDKVIYIQEFEKNDYQEVLGYLKDIVNLEGFSDNQLDLFQP